MLAYTIILLLYIHKQDARPPQQASMLNTATVLRASRVWHVSSTVGNLVHEYLAPRIGELQLDPREFRFGFYTTCKLLTRQQILSHENQYTD